jgi:hypothetical protein
MQASLAVRSGGLGVRSVSMFVSSAFLASAAVTQPFQALILRIWVEEEHISQSSNLWHLLTGSLETITPQDYKQILFDTAVANHTYNTLLNAQNEPHHRTAAADHSGYCLRPVLISSCGFRLTDGAEVDSRGWHALSSKHNSDRSQRHH